MSVPTHKIQLLELQQNILIFQLHSWTSFAFSGVCLINEICFDLPDKTIKEKKCIDKDIKGFFFLDIGLTVALPEERGDVV